MNLVVGIIIFVFGVGCYLWGYRDGVAYCVRKMKPLGDMAREMADEIALRRGPHD